MGRRVSTGLLVACAVGSTSCSALVSLDELGPADAASDAATTSGAGGSSAAGGGGGGRSGTTSGGGEGAAGGSRCDGVAADVAIPAITGLDGDGYLSIAPCGETVHDFYQQPTGCTGSSCTYKAIHMGVDTACSPGVVYRLFVRFDLGSVQRACVKTATLRLFYVEKQVAVAYPARLFAIEDFGTLDATDWNNDELLDLGILVGPMTPENDYVAASVGSAVDAALASGASHVAFKLQYENEAQDSGQESAWYGMVAAENGEKGPELLLSVAP